MNILEKAKKDNAHIFLKTSIITFTPAERDLVCFSNEFREDEKLLFVGKLGFYENTPIRMPDGTLAYKGANTRGVLVISDKKMVYMDKRIFTTQSTVILNEDIKTFRIDNSLFWSTVYITTHNNEYVVSDLKKTAGKALMEVLSNIKTNISEKRHNNNRIHVQHNTSVYKKIEEAHGLMEKGIISKEEFEKIKNNLLNNK